MFLMKLILLCSRLFWPKRLILRAKSFLITHSTKLRVIMIAVNMETRTPAARLKAKPWIVVEPK